MTATTIKQTEAAPEAYPDAPDGLSTAAAALDPIMVWQRIEAYTAWRWTERAVTWVIEGCGEWIAPLAPATITAIDEWRSDAWSSFAADASPIGGRNFPGGTFRVTATVGDDDADVPAAVLEAFRRLAEYMAADPGIAGATSESISIPDVMAKEIGRAPAWMARAIQNSGAGDLLRPYRRV